MILSERFIDLRDARASDPTQSSMDPTTAIQEGCLDAGALERDLRPVIDLTNAAGGADMLSVVPCVGAGASAMLAITRGSA
jgi:hypothetical protein